MPVKISATASPGAATSARALLEERLDRRTQAEVTAFLSRVSANAIAAYSPTTVTASIGGFALGRVLGDWAEHASRIVDDLAEILFPKPWSPTDSNLDPALDPLTPSSYPSGASGLVRQYLDGAAQRLRDQNLPELTYSSAHAVLSLGAEQLWSASRVATTLHQVLDPGGTLVAVTQPLASTSAPAVLAPVPEASTWTRQARRIARTEATGTYNVAVLQDLTTAPNAYRYKKWIAHHDARTRPTHRTADGQVRPVDASFSVGGYALNYPGDPSGPDHEIANCRCVLVGADRQG